MLLVPVQGVPTPQGSVRAFAIPGKNGAKPRAIITGREDRGGLRTWRAEIAHAIRAQLEQQGVHWPRPTPVVVASIYRFPMTKSPAKLDGEILSLKSTKPDRDKLDRAVGDAVTACGLVWDDDAQDAIGASAKLFVAEGEWTGALIILGHAEKETAKVMFEFSTTVMKYRQAMRAAQPARRGRKAA